MTIAREPIREVKFAGETIQVFHYPPDTLVEINGHYFGFYTTPDAGVNAAQKHIIQQLEEKN